jgi:anti-anti-sigma regulatory factor
VDPLTSPREPSAIDVRSGLGSSTRPVSLVLLRGEHDYGSRERLEAVLQGLEGHVLIDLSQCELIDTSIINVVLTRHRELRAAGFRLELIVPPTQVHLSRTFDLLGIRSIVHVHENPPLD